MLYIRTSNDDDKAVQSENGRTKNYYLERMRKLELLGKNHAAAIYSFTNFLFRKIVEFYEILEICLQSYGEKSNCI